MARFLWFYYNYESVPFQAVHFPPVYCFHLYSCQIRACLARTRANAQPSRVREEVPRINLIFSPSLLLPACCLLIYVLCLAKTHTGGTPIKSGWDPSCGWSLVSLAAMLRGLTQKASMRWRSRQMAGSKRVGTQSLPDCTWQEHHNVWWVPTRTLSKTKAGFLLYFGAIARSFDGVFSPPSPNPCASLDRFQRLNLKMICPALLIIDEST